MLQKFYKNDHFEIATPYGWEPFEGVVQRLGANRQGVAITLESNKKIVASSDHIFFSYEFEKKAKDLKINDIIDTKDGHERIVMITPVTLPDTYDIYNSVSHKVLINGILSHNCDELAFAKRADEFWQSISPTLACVTGDTYVLTSNGYRQIKDYHKKRKEGEYFIIDNLNVWTLEGIQKVSHGYVSPKSTTRKIRTASGLKIETTLEHPLYVIGPECNMGKMVSTKDLTTEHKVRIDCGMNQYGSLTLPESIIKAMAICSVTDKWTGLTSIEFEKLNELGLSFYNTKKRNNSRIPSPIFKITKQNQLLFLKTVFKLKGKILMVKGLPVYKVTMPSIEFAHEIKLLLNNMGIRTNLHTRSLTISKHSLLLFRELIGFDSCLYDAYSNMIAGSDLLRIKTLWSVVDAMNRNYEFCKKKLYRAVKKIRVQQKYNKKINEMEENIKTLITFIKKKMFNRECLLHMISCIKSLGNYKFTVAKEERQNVTPYYYWDRIIKISKSTNVTYDFTVPISHSFLQNGIMGSNTGGGAIVTSTPNSDEDLFAKLWFGACNTVDENGEEIPGGLGRNGYKALKITWDKHPERDAQYEKDQRAQLGDAGFEREMNCEFVIAEETLIDPLFLQNGFVAKEPIMQTGHVRWFLPIQPNYQYTVALDPSMGTGNGDYSTIQVFRLPNFSQVAEWRSQSAIAQEQMRVMLQILTYIDTSLRSNPEHIGEPQIYWTLENNSVGEAALTVIRDTGEDIFPGWFMHEPNRGLKRRKGLTTTNPAKLMACMKLKQLIETKKLTINSKYAISEFKSYIRQGAGFGAKKGFHDDLISAILLNVRLMQIVGQFDDSVYDSISDAISDDDDDYSMEPMPMLF